MTDDTYTIPAARIADRMVAAAVHDHQANDGITVDAGTPEWRAWRAECARQVPAVLP